MHKFRPLAAFILITVLLVSGCGKKEKEPEIPETSETAPVTETEAASSETEAETEPPVITAEVTAPVNFRSGPATTYDSYGVLSTGTSLTVLEQNGSWWKVGYNGQEGYIASEYLKLCENEVPENAEASSEAPEPETTQAASDAQPETPGGLWADPNNGVLQDNGRFDVSSLPNKDIPYGNDWEDKDEKGLPNGVHYYESLYGQYDPVFYINTDEKVIYLTLDEGYEAGYTPMILDTLKEKNVKAVFFLTKQFLDSDPELIQRMINEGHIIGNHTCNHPAHGYPLTVDEKGLQYFTDDVAKLHKLIYDQFGYDMRLFRFPEGQFSEQLLAKLDNMGYTSVFWSYAHYDYNENEQPDPQVTLERCMSHLAPGAVYLLHAKSSSNTAVLGQFIDQARAAGYEFGVFPVDASAGN